jgi:hypothetical protein
MGFRSVRENTTEVDRSSWTHDVDADDADRTRSRRPSQYTAQECEDLFGLEMYQDGLEVTVQRLADDHGAGQVRQWADEGMTVDTMGKPHDMRAFRDRQDERPSEVPTDVERRNARSVQRSRGAHHDASKAGDAAVPDSVRDVIASAGQQLDTGIQQTIEDRMGDTLGDVRIHTGPAAAKACQDINARAFTVGNHVAFNTGEYDPDSAEGQHVLAHELAHVRQQTQGAVSMLPQAGTLEIDPDERLEREADRTAERVMRGGELGIASMAQTGVHVQRLPEGKVFEALALFQTENQQGVGTEFRQNQNQNRMEELEDIARDIAERNSLQGSLDMRADARAGEFSEQATEVILSGSEVDLRDRLDDLHQAIEEKSDILDDIALTDDQREALYGDGEPSYLDNLGWEAAKAGLSLASPILGVIIAGGSVLEKALPGVDGADGPRKLRQTVKSLWTESNGTLEERAKQIEQEILDGTWFEQGDSTGDAQSRRN